MATRLRRLLFGAPHIASIALYLKAPGSLRRLLSDISPVQWFIGTSPGTVAAGLLPEPRPTSASGAPPTETVLVLISDSGHDAAAQLDFARSLGADVRAVYVDRNPDVTRRLLTAWARGSAGVPLLVLEGDGLPVSASLRAYVSLLARERTTGGISLVLPVCESGACWAKIRCVLSGIAARLSFPRIPGARVYGGGPAPARDKRAPVGCAAES